MWCALVACALAAAPARARVLLDASGNLEYDKNAGVGVSFGEQHVHNCKELQVALGDPYVSDVVVSQDIICTRSTWPDPVKVIRNVVVKGDRARHKSSNKTRPHTIDWTDVSNVVIAERGAVVYVRDLLIYQSEMGIGGLNLAFVQTRKGATGVFSGLVVVVSTCPQKVSTYYDMARSLPRPDFLVGEQATSSADDESLVVEDVAIWWPNINSLWQICNTVFICGSSSPWSPRVLRHFETMDSAFTCDNRGSTAAVVSKDSSRHRPPMSVAATSIVIVVVVGVVLLATGGMTYYLFGRHRRSKFWKKDDCSSRNHQKYAARDEEADQDDPLQSQSHTYNIFDNINVPLSDVVVGPLLGKGGFGKVYKGTWKGTTVAIKVIEHGSRLLENDQRQPFEAFLSKHVSHPNVVQTFLIHTRRQDIRREATVDTLDLNGDSLLRANPPQTSIMTTHDTFSNIAHCPSVQEVGELYETWLVLEYCDKGSLSKAVRRGVLTQLGSSKPMMDHVILSALDVANSINYLHSLGITHGDLKADNVLLKSANTDRRGFFCKVSDFGLSRFMGAEDYLETFTYGTITHMPPELLKEGILSPYADVYSFGMLLWELLSKTEHPFPNKNHGEIILAVVNEGRRPHLGTHYPEMYADLIRDCWKQNRADRPNFHEIVRRLKLLLADQEGGNVGSPSKSTSFSMNDSAGSWKKRSDSLKKKLPSQRGTADSISDVKPTLMMNPLVTSVHPGFSSASDGTQLDPNLSASKESELVSRSPLPPTEGLVHSSEDEYSSAVSHVTGTSSRTSSTS